MPYSSDEGKSWLAERIWDALLDAPIRIEMDEPEHPVLLPRLLDIGAGSGTYARLLAETRPAMTPHLTAVEIHAPYVAKFGLRGLYDEVLIGDAREIELPAADVVVLGDVLEHMSFQEAKRLWAKAAATATTAVFLSLPIIEWPQGPVDGNEHEAHVHTWTHHSVLANLPGIVEHYQGVSIGAYRALPGPAL